MSIGRGHRLNQDICCIGLSDIGTKGGYSTGGKKKSQERVRSKGRVNRNEQNNMLQEHKTILFRCIVTRDPQN